MRASAGQRELAASFIGTADRCRDAQFIFSHAGGTLPFLTERLVRLPIQKPAMQTRVPRGVLTELKRFFYGTAWSAHPTALASLTKLVPATQVLFGSDYPYRTGEDHGKGLMSTASAHRISGLNPLGPIMVTRVAT